MIVKEQDKIRVALFENSLSQVWLINRLKERGVITDKTELSSVLSGTRHGAKVDKIIATSADILEEYEAKMKK